MSRSGTCWRCKFTPSAPVSFQLGVRNNFKSSLAFTRSHLIAPTEKCVLRNRELSRVRRDSRGRYHMVSMFRRLPLALCDKNYYPPLQLTNYGSLESRNFITVPLGLSLFPVTHYNPLVHMRYSLPHLIGELITAWWTMYGRFAK